MDNITRPEHQPGCYEDVKRNTKKIERQHVRDVVTGSGSAFVLRVLAAAVNFGVTVILMRLLGASEAGVFFLGLSVVMIGSVIGRLGFDNVVVKWVAGASTTNDWPTVNAVVRFALLISLIFSMIIAAAAILLSSFIGRNLLNSPLLTSYLPLLSFGIVTFAAMSLISEALRGLKKIALSILVVGVIYPLIMLALVYPAWRLLGQLGLAGSFLLGTAVASAFGYWALRRSIPTLNKSKVDRLSILKSALALWPMMLVKRALLPWAPIVFLGVWSDTSEVGVFSAAMRFAVLISFVLIALNTVVAPKIAELHYSGLNHAIRPLAARIMIYLIVLTAPFFAVLVFQSDMIMQIFGQEFSADGSLVLSVLAIGQFALMIGGVPNQILMMTGKERVLGQLSVATAGLLILSLWVLIPQYGALGAAISSTIALWLLNGMTFVLGMAREPELLKR